MNNLCYLDKQVPIPSIYFIGKQGVSLEIVTEVADAVSLNKTLDQVLEKGGYTTAGINNHF